MRKNKGFTLVELLAVVVILGLLLAFASTSVFKIRKTQNEKNYKNVISSMLTGAKLYVADYPEVLSFAKDCSANDKGNDICISGNNYLISVKTLMDKKYIDVDLYQKLYKDLIFAKDSFFQIQEGDINPYTEYNSYRYVTLSECTGDKIGLKYSMQDKRDLNKIINYNDCGCELQTDGESTELCTD